MPATKRWDVSVFIDEDEGERTTHAEARLHTKDKTHLTGHGTARRDPHDHDVAEIGDELAAARALSQLADKLLHAAAKDIEAITHEPARVHG
jgi:hypothetical protein